ncbi:ABC transporter permease [Pseudoclavibacter endophyticus]|uniref:ABC transporter permease n=1 Tax=Pseudoclavibacter endophyticus TaxID=1778590 RepID=A0A6H9WN83_9MICO|nr:ABC transporter permease [Pseudoclavibacter endophyticus]KAB1648218.1 ABC transporter permease [Pseudoclavibacter endophyticus]GGA70720.1 ABC transporter permease [Pseudoclavibacter endophyticus]
MTSTTSGNAATGAGAGHGDASGASPQPPSGGPGTGSGPSRAISFWEGVKLVAKRDMLMQVRSRAFQVSFILTLVLVGGGIIAFGIFGQQSFGGDDAPTVAVTEETAPIVADAGLEATEFSSVQDAVAAVESGEADSAVLPATSIGEIEAYNSDGTPAETPSGGGFVIVGLEEPSSGVTSALTITPEGFALEQPTAPSGLVYLLTVFFGIMFFMSAITYCSTIAQSVVEEKQTRIVELLLATVSPRTIMAGKVLGNSLLALAQVAAIGLVSVLALAATGQAALFTMVGPAIVWFAVLFVVGFVLLAALYAGVAATVSRQEDVGTATTPLMFVIMIPYILSFFASENPVLMTVMSYVPFSAPIAMPVRVFTGDAMWWEPVASLVLLVLAAAVAIWIGSKIYENAVLRTGGRVKLSEALRG